ncbi:phosphoglucosamine mutase [Romeria aff. gracilis LEGE 07310]|uniref:Phosphoglucosamine mutase n=1 Tax=Vasconcelosia minhoensis LEGE 07310 TaxID=915328 RepID=A0A8J7DPI0_9CYAN|nr:phosphoglucosamine mutase [Romeria gracilis]MBE9079730.1 phosphoglucosamine mutase [Romeria aff. gracilis LEGE 07310]
MVVTPRDVQQARVSSQLLKAPQKEPLNPALVSHSSPNPSIEPALTLPRSPLFGTDGIRGRAGDLLSAPLAMQVGFWAGQLWAEQGQQQKTEPKMGPVIVGQDSRHSSDMLATALAAGLTSAGLEVWNLGLCPTAAVAYLAQHCQAVGGIMISASHNPPADNGIKFFGADGTKLSAAIQARIEAALRQGSDCFGRARWGHCRQRPELIQRYVEFLHQPFQPQSDLSGLRIVLDLAWGAASSVAEQIFAATGAEIVVIHGQPDGDRINVGCGSTHLAPLIAAVNQHGAEIGFAFDGDADRVMAVDVQGRVIDGDYILYFWGQTLKQAGRLPQDTIVSTVMANLGFERAWQGLGGSLVRTPVGDQHVHAEMVSRGAMLGGEQSGHILCHHYSLTGDGILTALHLADLIKRAGCSLPELMAQSFVTYPQRLQNVRVEDRDRRCRWQDCDPLQQAIAQAEAAMGDQGRVLVRASGTEPVIRVMVEAASTALVERWTATLSAVVEQHLAA